MRSLLLKVVGKIEMTNSKIVFKSKALTILYVLLISVSLGIPIFKESNSFSSIVLIGMLLTIAMISLLIQKSSINEYSIKKLYLILFEIIGISFFINGIFFSVIGYLAIGIIFSFLVPVFELVCASNVKFSMCKIMACGVFISFIAFIIISILCGSALGKTQYTSVFSNPNTLGNYMIIVNSSILFLIFDASDLQKKSIWIYLCALGIGVSIMVLTNSRTTAIAIICQLIFVFVVIIIKQIKKRDKNKLFAIIKKVCATVLICISMFIIIFFALTDLKITLIKIIPSIQITKEYDDVTFSDILGRTIARYTKGIDTSDMNEAKNDAFTSGRKEIWMDFIRNIKFEGHSEEGRRITEDTRFYANTNAHNVYIQVAYSAGIIAGVAMLLLILLTARDIVFKLGEFLRHGKLNNDDIFTICSAIGFSIVSLTSGGYMLYTYLPATLFYFSLYTLSIKKVVCE